MKYISTRDISTSPMGVSSAQAIKKGLAPDRGLYMPVEIPTLNNEDLEKLATLPYEKRACEILSMFLCDYDKEQLLSDCIEAYSEERFPGGAAPLVHIGDSVYSLELWHGPTCAFKDMALQIMPRLLSSALKMTGEEKKARILVATSGDTGKAALEGYKDVDGIDICVFFPVDGVSTMQKMQMTTQEGDNVRVCAVRGNFDDAQNGVKAIFADNSLSEKALSRGFFFSSANSINWGRLAPQIVYYVSAYCDLMKSGAISIGDKINVCVPTGNFGNIFAAYIAKTMGLPIDKLICASNANCVLTDFIRTGLYDRTRTFYKTMSPSMDILISSNLERLLYLLGGAEVTSDCMQKLSECGKYQAPDALMAKIRESFYGYSCNEEETAEVILNTYTEKGYLADPHTCVALGCLEKYRNDTNDTTPTVVASTASPYKFAKDVIISLGKACDSDEPGMILSTLEDLTDTTAPAPLKATLSMPVRFKEVCDPCEMSDFVFAE
ncbi:MAG: threonine synthase [Ruminococcaceae bacterium]|nr:threonine synthase [Oscillospiraceae bacterium]